MKRKVFLLSLFVFVFLCLVVNTYVQERLEYKKSYHFKITKIEVNVKMRKEFYDDSHQKIQFSNYTIMNHRDVRVGDSVSLDSCAASLKIFRIDKFNHPRLLSETRPTGTFPRSCFCNYFKEIYRYKSRWRNIRPCC
jgi:hypothetical protein